MKALWFLLAVWGYLIIGYLLACIIGKITDTDISDGGVGIIFMWSVAFIVLLIVLSFLLIAKLFEG